jgi:hypothetical protein
MLNRGRLLADSVIPMNDYTMIAVGCISMFYYDFFITFCPEIRLIWDSPWTMTKILFLVQRYLPFVDVALMLVASKIQFHPSFHNLY